MALEDETNKTNKISSRRVKEPTLSPEFIQETLRPQHNW